MKLVIVFVKFEASLKLCIEITIMETFYKYTT